MTESDSGIDLSQGNVCPMCGAQNNGEQTNCWQCRSLLLQNRPQGHLTPGTAERSQRSDDSALHSTERVYFWAAFLLLTLSAIVGGQQIARGAYYVPQIAPDTLIAFFQNHMVMTRIVLGAGLVVAAPFLLKLILHFFGITPRCSRERVLLVGLMPPALAFVLSWVPPVALPSAILVPGIVSWLLIQKALMLPPLRTAAVWASQGLGIGAMGVLGFLGLESVQAGQFLNPLAEYEAIRAWESGQNHGTPQREATGEGTSPSLKWPSSGSAWLDFRGNQAQIEIAGVHLGEQSVGLIESTTGEAIVGGTVSADSPWLSNVFLPKPGVPYRVQLSEGFSDENDIIVHSLLHADLSL